MLRKVVPAIGAVVAAAAVCAAPTAAKTIDVVPGQSIQAAVNLANPGDVIAVHQGVYHGSVRINKDDLTLRGAGATPQGTVLKPKPSEGVRGRTGISVFHHTDQHGQPVLTRGTDVSGFRVEGFAHGGAFVGGANRTVFRRNAFVDNGVFGAATGRDDEGQSSRGTKFISNRATGSSETGFAITRTPRAGALVKGNVSQGNDTGIYVVDSADGVIQNNVARRNCTGIELIDESRGKRKRGSNGKRFGSVVRGWTIENNRAPKNNRNLANCRRTYPALSGVGIALFGASDNVVEHNRVFDNRGKEPSGGCGCGVRLRPGGIVLFRTPFGRIPASHNTISHNTALRNEPADILWDGRGTGNAFLGNDCGSSGPRRLCH